MAIRFKRHSVVPQFQFPRGGFQPCEDDAVDDGNALKTGHSPTTWRIGQIDPERHFEVGSMNGQ
jgi:hypothetical protein